ncbi:DUF222 domain-containing protein [Dietzia aerolata]|uniref:HNH endonuclease signature motif containing protein n=1 Tax=Dietzia aerolata TaxID=595984 RepID=UPI0036267411
MGSEEAIAAFAQAARSGWEAENRAAAQRFITAHELMLQCLDHPDCAPDLANPRPGFTVVDPGEMAVAHLIAMYPITTSEAEAMIYFAADLHFRYPAILEAMADGRMDQTIAKVLADQMRFVDDALVHKVQQEVVDAYLEAIDSGERPSRRTVRSRSDRIITGRDRNAVAARKKDAVRDQCVRITKGHDGMASLYAVLHAGQAALLADAIEEQVAADRAAEEAAAAATAADAANSTSSTTGNDDTSSTADTGSPSESNSDSGSEGQSDSDSHSDAASTSGSDSDSDGGLRVRSMGERRVAAMLTIFLAGRAPHPGQPGTTTGTAGTGVGVAGAGLTLRPRVTVIAPSGGNLTGWRDRARVEYARTGEAALQTLLDMLNCSQGATLQYVDPTLGADDDPDRALRYRPGATLAHRIRLRDGTCRHPGCSMPAVGCDLDHVVPFDHDNPEAGGKTVEANMACLCRFHHRFKTFVGWDYALTPDGTLIITTPSGKTMYTTPDGPLAAFRREQAAAEAAAWDRQQHRSPDPNKAAATGGSNTCDHNEQTAASRRQSRAEARREAERATNAADWAERDKQDAAHAKSRAEATAARAKTKASVEAKRKEMLKEPMVETVEGPDGRIIGTIHYPDRKRPAIQCETYRRRFPDYTDYLDVQPCTDDKVNADSFKETFDPSQPIYMPGPRQGRPRLKFEDLTDSPQEHHLWHLLQELPPF